jgi:hypothetical protein
LSGAVFQKKVRNLYVDVAEDAEEQLHSFCNYKMTGNPAISIAIAKELSSLFKARIVEGDV